MDVPGTTGRVSGWYGAINARWKRRTLRGCVLRGDSRFQFWRARGSRFFTSLFHFRLGGFDFAFRVGEISLGAIERALCGVGLIARVCQGARRFLQARL